MTAEELVKAGQLPEALKALEDRVRKAPADGKLRVFLFQLLCVLGQWDRALTQLNVAADLDPANLLMAEVCRQALVCEAFRREVFAGDKLPLVLGEPAEWIGWLIQANQMTARGEHAEAQALRGKAFDAAPAIGGMINGQAFEWVSDGDQRLGPVLEVIVDGKYYWVPFSNIRELTIEKPTDLRDIAWIPATFTWANAGRAVGFIPTRYSGSEDSSDSAIRLARKTDWQELPEGLATGLGQRVFATDQAEVGLLEVRTLLLNQPVIEAAALQAEA